MTGYLIVRNWDKYQHYKDRRPPWIKFHIALLEDYELAALPIPTRLFWDLLLLLAGRHDNLVPNDSRWLAGQTALDERSIDEAIANLVQTRMVRKVSRKPPASTKDASDALALARADAPSLEAETALRQNPQAVKEGRATADESKLRGNIATGTLSEAHALRLVATLSDADAGTRDAIVGYADALPPAAFETIREKLIKRNGNIKSPSGYARAELQRMLKEGTYA